MIPFLLFRTMKRRPLCRGCLPGVQAGAMLVRAYCGRLSKVGWALCVLAAAKNRRQRFCIFFLGYDMFTHRRTRVFLCRMYTLSL